ncbi:hypothetical protein ABN48_06820 [Haemophilus influenzae]|uniref:hypothetical protein n=1 Tax=Haemophilus influenzae TaxID=727 RepID=UPI00067FB871|nr:hypothetical protein [Haemophilus influenzae]KMZ24214.1 hypothetical protein ABN54_03280 [Haemophilus influenzae]KMZ26696.1 hypothetical protein ABN48_06820 [Haemophilus influenzae]MCK9087363.1 hypothetical protein [Haemophilus influenzae]MCK9106976.1 hypothetical protein [Haemophilus influenzae]
MTTEQQKKKNDIVRFTVSYDAKDNEYAKHRIDADQLIEIVTNMKELINRADRTIHRRQSTVKLYLQAPVQSGSVEVPFLLDNASNAMAVLEYLGFAAGAAVTTFTGKGVLDVIKKTKGKSILEVKTTDKSNEATLVLDGKELTVDKKVARLVTNSKLRENIQQIVSVPLEGKIEPKFKVKLFEEPLEDNNEQLNEVVAKEVRTVEFEQSQVKMIENMDISLVPEIHTEEKEATIALTQISFTGSEKGWKMSYNGKTDVSVELLDENFIKKINKNTASFRKGDLFNVTLRITTRITGKRETVRYSIVKVKNHMASADRKIVSDQLEKREDE